MTIKQHKISSSINHFVNVINLIYQTKPYHNKNDPCLFFGVYNPGDLNTITNHQGKRIVIFTGGDLNRLDKLSVLKQLPQTVFIVSEKNLVELLNKHGITNVLQINKPFTKFYNHLTPIHRILTLPRNGIYIYTSPRSHFIYGSKIYKKIIKMLPQYQFHIYTSPGAYRATNIMRFEQEHQHSLKTTTDVMNIYHTCFIALCPTKFTKNALTSVTETGYYGLKCIHNSNRPNSINFSIHPALFNPRTNNEDPNLNKICSEICQIIHQEYHYIQKNGLYNFENEYNNVFFNNSVNRILNLDSEII